MEYRKEAGERGRRVLSHVSGYNYTSVFYVSYVYALAFVFCIKLTYLLIYLQLK